MTSGHPLRLNAAQLAGQADAERGQADVYLREDGDDLKIQVIPEARLAYIGLMKRDGWKIVEETAR
ncbi:hypothetical protein [Sorangium sp. So ce176]|uniref:hypothetical protein n=1 Tax=Sorangium sp. So ce176 TaxID=3133286 RepID=UPI003F6036AE